MTSTPFQSLLVKGPTFSRPIIESVYEFDII